MNCKDWRRRKRDEEVKGKVGEEVEGKRTIGQKNEEKRGGGVRKRPGGRRED